MVALLAIGVITGTVLSFEIGVLRPFLVGAAGVPRVSSARAAPTPGGAPYGS
jgi:hypothetical protein